METVRQTLKKEAWSWEQVLPDIQKAIIIKAMWCLCESWQIAEGKEWNAEKQFSLVHGDSSMSDWTQEGRCSINAVNPSRKPPDKNIQGNDTSQGIVNFNKSEI